jgi:hypothetical protein
MRQYSIGMTVIALVVSLASPAAAQAPKYQSYRPGGDRPALSRWLDLGRTDPGMALPAYHQFVVPKKELQNRLRQNEQSLERLRQETERNAADQAAAERMMAAKVRSTGRGGEFMSYSHFFPVLSERPK